MYKDGAIDAAPLPERMYPLVKVLEKRGIHIELTSL
jgi:hypothetical protein